MKIVLAALLGAVAMFLWEFVAHMFTPLGDAGMGYLPNETVVSPALASALGKQSGLYIFPTGGLTKDSSKEEMEQGMNRMLEEMKTKPSGLVLYKPPGTEFHFGKNLAVQFLTDFAKALLAVLLLAQTRLTTFGSRVGFVVLVGAVAAIATNIPLWNWYGFPVVFTLAYVVMEILSFFFAGLAIALIWKRSPASV